MQNFTQVLTNRWFLKVCSLILATLLWMAIASKTSSEIGMDVPLEYRNIPVQLELMDETENIVHVRLRGSSNVINEVTTRDVSSTIDLSGMKPGIKVVPLTADNISVPFGVEVVRVSPSSIRLNLELTLSKTLPVTPTLEGLPMPGYEVQEITTVPDMVEVQGPESRVRRIEFVPTAPLQIEGRQEDMRESVDLEPTEPMVRLMYGSPVEVHVKIRPKNFP
jgi:YbbR domain-containing protein